MTIKRVAMHRDFGEYRQDAAFATGALVMVCFVLQMMTPYAVESSAAEKTIARNLVEQATHWYHAALQDKSAHMRAQHIAYANAYIHAARHVMNDSDLERITSSDVHALQSVIENTQQSSMKDLQKQCPRLKTMPEEAATVKRSWA